jgi:hypothetical protein
MSLGGWEIGEDLEKGSLSASSANDPFLVDSSSDSSDESDEESSDISDEEESTPTAAPGAPFAYQINVNAPNGTPLINASIESAQSRPRKRKRGRVPESERKRRRKMTLRERVEEASKKPPDPRRNTPGEMLNKFPKQSFSITAESTYSLKVHRVSPIYLRLQKAFWSVKPAARLWTILRKSASRSTSTAPSTPRSWPYSCLAS